MAVIQGVLKDGQAFLPIAVTPEGSVYVIIDGQPIPGTVTVIQPTHDNLNANVNLQVGDADVGPANPVPVSGAVSSPSDGAATADNQAAIIAALQSVRGLRGALSSVAVDKFRVEMMGNVVTAFNHGSNSVISDVAVPLIDVSMPVTLGVEVKAAGRNNANVYIGNSDVTAASADATDGMELRPGESIFVRVDDVSKIYAIAAVGKKPKAQRVFWLAV